jgi:hypothetical protein
MAAHRSGFFVILCVTSVSSVVSLLGGCANRVDATREFTVAPGGYPAAFDATRELLRGMDFTLERVDADGGVISTEPRFSRGLLEPWDATQTGLSDEWEDTVNMQARAVRVTFTQAGAEPTDETAETLATVWVTLYRNHRSGRRLDSEWVGGSTFAGDPLQQARHTSVYLVPTRRDEALEARLADKIMRELGEDANSK